MKSASFEKQYDRLTPEERFLLIDAALERDDTVQVKQLAKAGRSIELSIRDFQPYAMAFREISLTAFMEAANLASVFRDMMMNDTRLHFNRQAERGWERREDETTISTTDEMTDEEVEDNENEEDFRASYECIQAAGFVLRQKVRGWKLFCKKLGVSPFTKWERYPGFERVMELQELSKSMTFDREGMIRWLNERREKGTDEVKTCVTARWQLKVLQKHYRGRVRWWSGRKTSVSRSKDNSVQEENRVVVVDL